MQEGRTDRPQELHVTLLAEELINKHVFDNNTERVGYKEWENGKAYSTKDYVFNPLQHRTEDTAHINTQQIGDEPCRG